MKQIENGQRKTMVRHPVFTVHHVSAKPVKDFYGCYSIHSMVNACISWGAERMFVIVVRGWAHSEIEAIKEAINKLLNEKEAWDISHHVHEKAEEFYDEDGERMSVEWSKKIYYDFSSLQEPWRGLFEQLFGDGWEIPKELTDGR